MKFTVNWLRDHLDFDADLETLLYRLTMVGLEVEKVTDRAQGLESFVVAQVLEAVQHPNADKLRVCKVDNGTEIFEVVCGAPNARTGLIGVFAGEGSFIPGTGIKLKKTEIRDVESNGMLLSEREMGLSDEHDGIIELAEGTPIGTPAVEAMGLNDPIIEIAITPNRGDCLGVRGIARDLAASGLGTLKTLDTAPVPGAFESPTKVVLGFSDETKSACPYFIGRTIRGVANAESPAWLKERLLAIGLRPISALVDITNYVTFDLGRPLHVFDLAEVTGDIRPRMAKPGETLLALDGKTYELDEDICVIADDAKAEGLGGVMGGEETGCTETTTEVFVECAYFDPIRTAMTGRKLNIMSDARYRFERGVDPAFLADGMEIATRMILDLCGGEPSNTVVAGGEPEWQRDISMRADRPKTLGGVDVADGEIERILGVLGFTTRRDGDAFIAGVPSWRSDIVDEACLVEEVLRLYGYDKIPVVPLRHDDALPGLALSPAGRRRSDARRALAARGMVEAVTYSFLAEADALRFGDVSDAVRLVNPISADLDVMRPSLLPNLISAAGRNAARGTANAAIFEVGPQYTGDKPDQQAMVVAGIRTGTTGRRHWDQTSRVVDAYDAKADALAVLAELGIPAERLQVAVDAPAHYHPGRAGVIRQGPKNILARFGEVHPGLVRDMDLTGAVAAFEIYLDNLPQPKQKKGAARAHLQLSSYQKVERDFAFIVDNDISAQDIVSAVKGADKALISDVTVFDVFAGGSVGEGKKSLAVSVTLQPAEATLTDTEIEDAAARIVASVTQKTGAALRG
ncbi:MAG: phenylalanine--tRNA ligase subunit beta [Rhodospirillaceae bacterium]|nr:phenylalanine--tRNA ligase subunit beta [Rhodospirillaceae bacterium]